MPRWIRVRDHVLLLDEIRRIDLACPCHGDMSEGVKFYLRSGEEITFTGPDTDAMRDVFRDAPTCEKAGLGELFIICR